MTNLSTAQVDAALDAVGLIEASAENNQINFNDLVKPYQNIDDLGRLFEALLAIGVLLRCELAKAWDVPAEEVSALARTMFVLRGGEIG